MSFLDLIFPKRCINCKAYGDYICQNCFTFISFDPKSLCLVCNRQTFNNQTHQKCKKQNSIDGCFSALNYNKIVKKLIYSFKNKPYLVDLQKTLSELFLESIIQNENFIKQIEDGSKEWVLVPIPLSFSKKKKRGYNQSEILAKSLSKMLKIKSLNILKREEGIRGAFAINKVNIDIKNKKIFLVDDVVNTGNTLKEATRILKLAGINKVFGLTLARK